MSAPRSFHEAARRRGDLLIERVYLPNAERCITAIVKLLTYRSPAERQQASTDPPAENDESAGVAAPADSGREV
jgi:hypothetical protein